MKSFNDDTQYEGSVTGTITSCSSSLQMLLDYQASYGNRAFPLATAQLVWQPL